MDILNFSLAILALFVGAWHLLGLRSQAKTLGSQEGLTQKHKEILDSIKNTLTTRHIGQFPDYMKTIASLVDRATKDIVILCDFPAYGFFSARPDFLQYRQALESKIEEGKSIRITTLESSRRVSLTQEQFPEWEKWKNNPTTQARLGTLMNTQDKTIVGNLTVERFADLLEERDVLTLDLLKGPTVSACEVKAHIPIYLWIIDGAEAVFSIPSFTEKATEHGFYTSDTHLIAGFQDLEARYRKAAEL